LATKSTLQRLVNEQNERIQIAEAIFESEGLQDWWNLFKRRNLNYWFPVFEAMESAEADYGVDGLNGFIEHLCQIQNVTGSGPMFLSQQDWDRARQRRADHNNEVRKAVFAEANAADEDIQLTSPKKSTRNHSTASSYSQNTVTSVDAIGGTRRSLRRRNDVNYNEDLDVSKVHVLDEDLFNPGQSRHTLGNDVLDLEEEYFLAVQKESQRSANVKGKEKEEGMDKDNTAIKDMDPTEKDNIQSSGEIIDYSIIPPSGLCDRGYAADIEGNSARFGTYRNPSSPTDGMNTRTDRQAKTDTARIDINEELTNQRLQYAFNEHNAQVAEDAILAKAVALSLQEEERPTCHELNNTDMPLVPIPLESEPMDIDRDEEIGRRHNYGDEESERVNYPLNDMEFFGMIERDSQTNFLEKAGDRSVIDLT
jgi:hypothetical protein